MNLALERRLRLGTTLPLLPEGATDLAWRWQMDELRAAVELIDTCGYDSIWAPDHVVMTVPILDPLLQLAQAAIFSRRLIVGTGVYLLPLRSAGTVAKMVSTLDQLTEGRLIFGVGVGGEYAKEFELCGIATAERGARQTDSLQVLKKLWSGAAVSHDSRFVRFAETAMRPAPYQRGGPPIWCGGRADAALKRAAEIADGYLSYLVTPAGFAEALAKMQAYAQSAKRIHPAFGTAHLLFVRIEDSVEAAFEVVNATLSRRYRTDFSRPSRKYAALGPAQEIASRIREFHAAGVRHLIVDFSCADERPQAQLTRFAQEVMPLIRDLTAG